MESKPVWVSVDMLPEFTTEWRSCGEDNAVLSRTTQSVLVWPQMVVARYSEHPGGKGYWSANQRCDKCGVAYGTILEQVTHWCLLGESVLAGPESIHRIPYGPGHCSR